MNFLNATRCNFGGTAVLTRDVFVSVAWSLTTNGESPYMESQRMVDVRLSLFSQDSSWVHGRIKESGWESASWHQWSNASGLESFIPRIRYCSEDQLLGGFRGSEMCFEQVKDNRTTGKSSSLSPGQYLLINTHYKVFLDWDKPPLEASFPGFPLWFMTQSTFSLITKKCLIK